MKRADTLVVAGKILTMELGDDGDSGPHLCGDMENVGEITDGALVVCDGKIVEVGTSRDLLRRWEGNIVEYLGCTIVPGLVDSHTHPIFAGSRADEFTMRARGASYEAIHARGGGIASTVRSTCEADDAELERLTRRNLMRMAAHGTTACEVKSGYGLTVKEELRELRILNKLAKELPLDITVTFLGAHAVPEAYASRRDDYVKLVIEEMLPAVVKENLAEWIDVFCENGAFNVEQSRRILEAGRQAGLGARIHAEEFAYLGGARMAAEVGAASCDHLQSLVASDYPTLKQSGIVAVLTPGTSFFLGEGRYTHGREMIDAGLPVALATDFNAGSNLTLSMPMAMSLAVLRLKMSPAEALTAATINSAHSIGMASRLGSLKAGKQADFVVIDTCDWKEWPYYYGVNLVKHVYKKGRRIEW